MIGAWIKMRGSLASEPRLIRLARILNGNREFRDWLTPGGGGSMNGDVVSRSALRSVTVGALCVLWSNAREHGKFVGNDLVLDGLKLADLDEMAGVPCMGQAMSEVGWALESKDKCSVTLPEFKRYNVPLDNAERQAQYRKRSNEKVTTPSLRSRNKSVTRVDIEKRKSNALGIPNAYFAEFWDIYPTRNGRKVGKKTTAEAFSKISPPDVPLVIQAAKNYAADKRTSEGFAKDPHRFLQSEFWRDWLESPAPTTTGGRIRTVEEILADPGPA